MNQPKHLAVYGNTVMERAFCEGCEDTALIIDGLFACCRTPSPTAFKRRVRMSSPEKKRKKPPKKKQIAILARQKNACIYCERKFGSMVYRDSKIVRLRLNWDHEIPFGYSQNNHPENYVAACHICNSIKGSKMYADLETARSAIAARRMVKGFEDL